MKISLIVAVAGDRRVIGRDQGMPWRLRDDLKLFKRITLGHPILMGRRTWESIGKPLPGRTNIVLSRQDRATLALPGSVLSAPDIDSALNLAEKHLGDDGVLMVIGGGRLYEQLLPRADRLHLTQVDAELSGDTFFPALNPTEWEPEGEVERFEQNKRNEYAFTYQLLKRRPLP